LIKKKRACLNIENNDDKCFLWCVLAGIHPLQQVDHPERVSKYRRYENELIMDGIEYPVKIRDIDRFERLNGNISVSVDENLLKAECSSSRGVAVYL